MRENRYQASLIKTLKRIFPGCVVIKNDPQYIQGFPDLLVLFSSCWAALEVKASAVEPFQPNQEYYLDLLDHMSFAATIYPENEAEVLRELQLTFGTRR